MPSVHMNKEKNHSRSTAKKDGPGVLHNIKRLSRFQKGFALILILEAIYLIYSFWLLTVPNRVYSFSGEELVSEYGVYLEDFLGEYGDGYYLDNSLHADEEALAELGDSAEEWSLLTIASPEVDLPRGSWKITISYNSSYLATYTASSAYNTYVVQAGRQSVGFEAAETGGEYTYTLYTPIAVENYVVTAQFRGTGYLFITDITFQETSAWKQVNLFIALFVFLLLDFLALTQLPERIFHGGNNEITGNAADPKTDNPQGNADFSNRSGRLLNGLKRLKWDPSQRLTLFVMLITVLFVSSPIFTFYLYDGPDLEFHLNRIEAVKTALLQGQFPVRLSSYWNNGYGYASSVMYGDIFLYIPAVLRIIGFTVQDAYKIFVFLINAATCTISYYSFRKISGSRYAALTGSVLYTLSVFRLIDLYMRGAAGEYIAITFLPLIAYGLWRIYTEPTDSPSYRHSWVPAVLGYSGLILSHVITTVIAAVFTILLCLILIRRTLQLPRFRQLCKVVLYTVLLNLWFLLPFLDYFRTGFKMTTSDMAGRFHANAVTLSELMNFLPDRDGSYHAVDQYASGEAAYTIGAGLLAAGVIYLGMRLYGKIRDDAMRRVGDVALGIGILSLLMSTDLFPWDFIQQLGGVFELVTLNIQLPWRVFGISSAAMAIDAVVLVRSMRLPEEASAASASGTDTSAAKTSAPNRTIELTSAVLVLLAVLSASSLITSLRGENSFVYLQEESDLDSTDLVYGEYLPEGTDTEIFLEDEPETEGRLSDLTYEKKDGVITISCRNDTDSETWVDVSFLYYKGYRAKDTSDGTQLTVVKSEANKVRVIIPAGYGGTFSVRFSEPWYWRVCEVISLLMLAALIYTAVREKKSMGCPLAENGDAMA